MRLLIKNLLGGRHHLLSRLPRNELLKQQRCCWLGTTSCNLQDVAAGGGASETGSPGGSGGGGGGVSASPGFLREAYHCDQEWNKRLDTPLLQKINIDDFFYDIDKRYQTDKVISAIDVDLFVNKVTDEDNFEELEELVHRLRSSPATADALPSTSYALIRAFLKAGRIDDLMRILNDRWNYGVFVDYHVANILMDEFLKQGNNRDAAKVASLLMLEEDFGSPTSRYFTVLSCLKYLNNPTPDPWETSPPKEESEEEVKVRLNWVRNPYFDDHFDLSDPNHVIGKTLHLVAAEIKEDLVLSRSVKLMGLALHGKWDKVEFLLQACIKTKAAIAEEAITKSTELCDKALSEVEASPNKTLPKPKVHQYPGVNLDEKDLNEMWQKLNYPEYEKVIPKVKSLLASNQIAINKDFKLIQKTQDQLSSVLAEREDKEIQDHLKAFQEWNERRVEELDKQLKRFRTFEVTESVAERKKELQEKEEVIFFFDNEEEWMMRLPPDQQQGYKLPTDYTPANWTPFVRSVPPKKERRRKKP